MAIRTNEIQDNGMTRAIVMTAVAADCVNGGMGVKLDFKHGGLYGYPPEVRTALSKSSGNETVAKSSRRNLAMDARLVV